MLHLHQGNKSLRQLNGGLRSHPCSQVLLLMTFIFGRH